MANYSWYVVCTLFFLVGLNIVVANTSPKVPANSAPTEWKYKGRSVRFNPSTNQTLPTPGTKIEPKSSATVNQPLKYEHDKDVRRIANAFSPMYNNNNQISNQINNNQPQQQSKNVSTVFNSRRKLPKFASSTKIHRLPTKSLTSTPPAFRHPKLKLRDGKVVDNGTNLNSSESKQYYGYEDRAWHVPYFYPNHDHGRNGEHGTQNVSQPMVELVDGPAVLANDSPQDDYGNSQDDGVDYDDDDGTSNSAATANANQDPSQQQQPQEDDNTQDDDNDQDNDQDSQSIMEEVDAEVDAADPDDPDDANNANNSQQGDDEEDD